MEAEQVKNVVTDTLLKEPEKDVYGTKSTTIDYVSQGQIMVTITLAEYRALVRTNADKEVSEARSKVYSVERERDDLKKTVTDLQKQLNDLKAMIAGAATIQSQINQNKEDGND